MSKLGAQDKFLDFSDYGRPLASLFVRLVKNTAITPVHITLLFGISGLAAVYCILERHYFTAAFFILLKSVLDAADGELARVKQTPSYTGRYLDSIFDFILNVLIFLAIGIISKTSFWLTAPAFICFQLQGTIYNYYYVILRTITVGGDATSKVFEHTVPKAFPGEKQQTVNILFIVFSILYGVYDKTIHRLDRNATQVKTFPGWFMTLVSVYGLGFQLLIIAILLSANRIDAIIPFFLYYSLLLPVFIGIRKTLLPD